MTAEDIEELKAMQLLGVAPARPVTPEIQAVHTAVAEKAPEGAEVTITVSGFIRTDLK